MIFPEFLHGWSPRRPERIVVQHYVPVEQMNFLHRGFRDKVQNVASGAADADDSDSPEFEFGGRNSNTRPTGCSVRILKYRLYFGGFDHRENHRRRVQVNHFGGAANYLGVPFDFLVEIRVSPLNRL